MLCLILLGLRKEAVIYSSSSLIGRVELSRRSPDLAALSFGIGKPPVTSLGRPSEAHYLTAGPDDYVCTPKNTVGAYTQMTVLLKDTVRSLDVAREVAGKVQDAAATVRE